MLKPEVEITTSACTHTHICMYVLLHVYMYFHNQVSLKCQSLRRQNEPTLGNGTENFLFAIAVVNLFIKNVFFYFLIFFLIQEPTNLLASLLMYVLVGMCICLYRYTYILICIFVYLLVYTFCKMSQSHQHVFERNTKFNLNVVRVLQNTPITQQYHFRNFTKI